MANLTDFGAVSDARELRDVQITSGSSTLNSASGPFTVNDVGKHIIVAGAGSSGTKLCTTISAYVSATQVTLAAPSAATVSNIGAVFGSDCSLALQAALDHIITTKGGLLMIDGLFLLATPVSKSLGGETAGIGAKIVGSGSDSAIWIGVAGTSDAISLTSGSFEFRDVSFIGVPGASRDARRIFNLTAVGALFENVGFHGLLGTEAVIYASQCYLETRHCSFGGCFVAGNFGYVNCVVENKNWYAYRDTDSQFIDYGYFRGRQYGKSNLSGTLGWIRADSPNGNDGARGESVFRLDGTRLDEGSLHGVVVKPTTGTIAHVHLSGVRQNITSGDTGRGIHCQNVQSVILKQCWQGWSTSPAPVGHFQDCGTVLIDAHKVSDSVNSLSAVNVESVTLRDSPGISVYHLVNAPIRFVASEFGAFGVIKDGPVEDTDFPMPPAIGTLGFDRDNNRLYFKRVTDGGWIYFDMDGGDPLGPEEVVNGTFDSNTTGWTPVNGATLSVVDSALRITNGAPNGRAYQAVPTVVGQKYQVSIAIGSGTSGRLVRVGTSQGTASYVAFSGVGGTGTFVATTNLTYITLMLDNATVGKYGDFDNVSLRAI